MKDTHADRPSRAPSGPHNLPHGDRRLEVQELGFGYDPERPLLVDVSVQVAPGEVVVLLGASGSGKSTLLRCITGLETPESGRVLWSGQPIDTLPTHRRRIGLMFQEPALFPHMDVKTNVAFGIRYREDAKAIDEDAEAARWIRIVGLEAEAGRDIDALSGGQRQRVALARTLAAAPRAVLLDEPLSALDRDLRIELGAQIRTILREAGVPTLWVTHDEEEAARVGDRVLRLVDGRLVDAQADATSQGGH